jgi:hypothetical protein
MSEKIYLSGLPFTLQGWNNVYTKNETNNNTYHLAPYTLYYLFPILGTTISKINGRWELTRDCDYRYSNDATMDIYKLGKDQDTPFGDWTYGVKVKKI